MIVFQTRLLIWLWIIVIMSLLLSLSWNRYRKSSHWDHYDIFETSKRERENSEVGDLFDVLKMESIGYDDCGSIGCGYSHGENEKWSSTSD